MDVQPIPGLEHLPYAEVWFHSIDDTRWREASNAARAIGKSGLEAWTTTRTPEVAEFLRERGYAEHRRYVISELDVPSVEVEPPRYPLVTLAERPGLREELFALARVAYADQPGRAETRIDDAWYAWGLDAHPPESYFVALEGERVLGYGYLERHEDGSWWNGFMAVAREARGRGVAGAVKRAQIAWAKANGVPTLKTANEARLGSMLDLNRRLGYVPVYEEVVLRGMIFG